jgi:protocatechuate 3,4-dioxygenase, alpha subunit
VSPHDRPAGDGVLVATASQTVGPFFHFGLATNTALGTIAPGDAAAERIRLRIRVLDGDAVPTPDALIELYHADGNGAYPASPSAPFSGFGRLATDADGTCVFETSMPGPVADGRGGVQARHVNVCFFARGLLRHLYTRIYFEADPAVETDPLLSLVPMARRTTLLARPSAGERGTWQFTIRLQGEQETVFFDV